LLAYCLRSFSSSYELVTPSKKNQEIPTNLLLWYPSPLCCLLLSSGHYGGAWYRQKIDFSGFPGAVLATTNCVLDPPKSYKHRLFTTNEVCNLLSTVTLLLHCTLASSVIIYSK
jgi:hypothetical protein